MKLQIHFIRFDSDYKLIKLIKRKLVKLETFYNRIIDGEVFLKIENNEFRINKIIEIKLNIPGDQLFAKERARTFEIGVDEVTEALRRQIKKVKEKQLFIERTRLINHSL
jgi:putative sigma-54 modulation protein